MLKRNKILLNLYRNYRTTKKQILNPSYANTLPVYDYVPDSDRNRVYVWGNYQTGALGSPHKKEKENLNRIEFYRCPRRLFFAEKTAVQLISAGFGFTLFATENKVYGTGLNRDSQIGYHDVRAGHPLEILFMPRQIHLPTTDDVQILKISAGRAHSGVLTSEGLFMFGNNAYGQCGRQIVENENYNGSKFIHHVPSIDGKIIVDIICGQDHSLVIMEDGSVYGCGWGADGQTGLGHYKCVSEFTKVGGDIAAEKISKISCRSDFVLAVNDKNEVFGWGNTEYSQITNEQGQQQECNPKHIKFLNKIVDVASGGSHCLALSDDGQVFVWGFGLLGLGPNTQETSKPLQIPPQLFGQNEFNTFSKVASVHAGLGHSAAITNDGNLYTWGRNRMCCLGIDFEKDQYFPYKVSMSAHVQDVTCGLDHTLALCKSFISKK